MSRNQHAVHQGSSAAVLLAQAENNRLKGRYSEALEIALNAQVVAEAANDKKVLLNCFLLLAKVHTVKGDLKAAFSALMHAEAEAKDANDEFLLGTTLYMSAYIKKLLGLQSDALSDIERAQEIALRLGDPQLLYWSYNRAGVVQTDLRRYDIADDFLRKALDYSKGLGDEEKFCILNNLTDNIALWEDELSESGEHIPLSTLKRGRDYGLRALVYARKAKNSYREAMILDNLGLVYGLLGQFGEAFAVLDLSEQLASAEGYRSLTLSAAHYRGKVLLLAQEPRKAIDHLEQALRMSENMSEDFCSRDICRCLAAAYEAIGDATLALMHYRNHHKYDRKIASAQASLKASIMVDRVAIMNAQLDAEKARAEQEEMASRSAALEQSLQSLQAFAREATLKANTDALTGLYNRHFLEEEFARRHDKASFRNEPFCAVLLDIDHFKHVNDRFGHAVGDDVLKLVARTLTQTVAASGIAVRYGGEEIAILLPNQDLAFTRELCERLRTAIEVFNWSSLRPGLAVTASFGVAQLQHAEQLGSLFNRADLCLYQAKNSGRNQVCSLLDDTFETASA